jgi:hypothetical protein
VPLLSFYKTPQLVGAVNKSLALVLDFLDGLLVFLLYLHKFFEFLLEPLQLLFKRDNPRVLSQLSILLSGF